jgi:hypothetical protein
MQYPENIPNNHCPLFFIKHTLWLNILINKRAADRQLVSCEANLSLFIRANKLCFKMTEKIMYVGIEPYEQQNIHVNILCPYKHVWTS